MSAAVNSPAAAPAGRLLVCGSINEDIALDVAAFPAPGQTVMASGSTRATGGKGANQATAAALYGADVTMIGAVGDDRAGRAAEAQLAAAGVDTSLVRSEAALSTGTAHIYVRSDGENTIVVDPGANSAETIGEVADQAFLGASWCLLSLEIPETQAMRFAVRARDNRVKVALNASPALNGALAAGLVDVLIVNEGEATGLAGEGWQSLPDVADHLGVEAVVVTLGGDGVIVFQRGAETVHLPAEKVEVLDTTGCGDAFAGVMLAALTSGKSYPAAAQEATRFAGRAAEHPGAMAAYFHLRDS